MKAILLLANYSAILLFAFLMYRSFNGSFFKISSVGLFGFTILWGTLIFYLTPSSFELNVFPIYVLFAVAYVCFFLSALWSKRKYELTVQLFRLGVFASALNIFAHHTYVYDGWYFILGIPLWILVVVLFAVSGFRVGFKGLSKYIPVFLVGLYWVWQTFWLYLTYIFNS